MRTLAVVAAALLLTACTADSTEPETAPVPAASACEPGALGTMARRQPGNKLWDDDWLAPVSAGQQGCIEEAPAEAER
jgi:hypothetical protein